MSFANPYNFVGIDENNIQTRNAQWLRHNKFLEIGGYSGRLICHVIFLRDFIIAGINTKEKKSQITGRDDKPIIPASSLKGLLRATAEAVSNSCLSVMGNEHKTLVNANALIDSCDKNKLCIVCRLFGTTAKKDAEGNEDFNYGGKVRIYDATYLVQHIDGTIINDISWKKGSYQRYLKKHALSIPRPKHKGFYFNNNKIKGRKFYYHHQQVDNAKILAKPQNGATPLDLVKKDSAFQFEISFENLTESEYGLLLWVLELEEGLGHKIGMAKPLGLGSCIIYVKEIREYSKNRYLNLNDAGTVYSDIAMKTRRKDTIRGYWTTPIPDDLKCILKIDNGFSEIRYPDKNAGEFEKYTVLHGPCKGFDEPTDKTTPESIKPTHKQDASVGKDSQMMEAMKKAGFKKKK